MDEKQTISGLRLLSLCAHAGESPRVNGSTVTPIFQTSTFLHTEGEAVRYTRLGNNPSQLVSKGLLLPLPPLPSLAMQAENKLPAHRLIP